MEKSTLSNDELLPDPDVSISLVLINAASKKG